MTDTAEPFDAEQAVTAYRRVIAQLGEESTVGGIAELATIIRRMRKAWKDRQGEDSLHERAFGKPIE